MANARWSSALLAGSLVMAALSMAQATVAPSSAAENKHDYWILVDTKAQTLSVLKGDTVHKTFPHIALGRNGAAAERLKGDDVTPLGDFHVAWVRRRSPFHLFFGLDYPNREHAERAFKEDLIDVDTYYNIRVALARGELPPQDSPLGGFIGIHGLGRADPKIHRDFNWTRGCIAVTNREIEQLDRWIHIGTRVVIR